MVLPYRATLKTLRDDWNLKLSDDEKYVFCHNDLSQQNIIVDPESLKIKAIIDWEYAGFFPAEFEMPFFERIGPSIALDGEEDDPSRIVEFLQAQSVRIFMWGDSPKQIPDLPNTVLVTSEGNRCLSTKR